MIIETKPKIKIIPKNKRDVDPKCIPPAEYFLSLLPLEVVKKARASKAYDPFYFLISWDFLCDNGEGESGSPRYMWIDKRRCSIGFMVDCFSTWNTVGSGFCTQGKDYKHLEEYAERLLKLIRYGETKTGCQCCICYNFIDGNPHSQGYHCKKCV